MEKDCNNCRFEHYRADEIPCIHCGIDGREYWLPKAKTNAYRIRAMTDEELAAHLVDIGFDCHLCSEHRRLDNEPLLRNEKCDERCEQHCLEWLQQPAEGDA